ncbi:hypothetical protein C806_01243 [Lachnospiraceae bacterium 3-1]|nr:hypothetical protein C806_01243 [Lachnospiraceae bacterium 3-1]
MAKVKRQTYTLNMYLEKLKDMDIRSDADVQRLSGAWNNAMTNELIVSVLNGEYIPPIILGQEKNSQAWIVDGLQRSTALMMFRYGNYRVTSSVEEPSIAYRAKVRDAEGNVKIDGCGDIIWEDREFDIRRKSFNQMPEELQKIFNEFQLDCIIHENYTMEQISRLVRRFNFNKPMNVSQRAFTFCDKYARKIREILKREFFIEAKYTKAERKNGAMERILMETVMCTFHLGNWKKSSQIGAYINENATMEEFESLESCIGRLENIITEDLYGLFTSKDSFILFTLFHRFTKLNMDDKRFADFLHAFKDGLCDKEVDGKIFYESGRSLKDRPVIVEKLDILETLMCGYLGVQKPEPEIDLEDALGFVRENIDPFAAKEDIEQYAEVLDALMRKAGCNKGVMEAGNMPSLIGIVAYSFENDIDLDGWIVDYCNRNDSYISNQAENYEYMRNDLQRFIKGADSAHTDAA